MSLIQMQYVPDEAELLSISQLAQAQHLHLITNDKCSMLCSVVPKGWRKMRVNPNPITKQTKH